MGGRGTHGGNVECERMLRKGGKERHRAWQEAVESGGERGVRYGDERVVCVFACVCDSHHTMYSSTYPESFPFLADLPFTLSPFPVAIPVIIMRIASMLVGRYTAKCCDCAAGSAAWGRPFSRRYPRGPRLSPSKKKLASCLRGSELVKLSIQFRTLPLRCRPFLPLLAVLRCDCGEK